MAAAAPKSAPSVAHHSVAWPRPRIPSTKRLKLVTWAVVETLPRREPLHRLSTLLSCISPSWRSCWHVRPWSLSVDRRRKEVVPEVHSRLPVTQGI